MERGEAMSLTASGRGAASVLRAGAIPAASAEPEALAEALAALRSGGVTGQLRLVLPSEVCENFLRVSRARGPRREFAASCVRWVEDEYGVDAAEHEIRVSVHTYADGQAGAVSVLKPGWLASAREALARRKVDDVVFVSLLDALLLMARQEGVSNGHARPAFLHLERSHVSALIAEAGMPVFYRGLRRDLALAGAQEDKYERMRAPLGQGAFLAPESVTAVAEDFARTLAFGQRGGKGEPAVDHVVVSASGVDVRAVAARVEELCGAPARPAAPGSGWRLDASDPKVDGVTENWAQVAIQAAAAAPVTLRPETRLLDIPSPLARALSPSRVAVGVFVLYLVALAGVWAYLALTAQALRQTRKDKETERIRLQAELNARRADYERRGLYRELARTLMRMKQQGVFAADVLATLNNERPEEAKIREIMVEAEAAACAATVVVAMPEQAGVMKASRVANDYVLRLRKNGLFESVVVEQPSPKIEAGPLPSDSATSGTVVEAPTVQQPAPRATATPATPAAPAPATAPVAAPLAPPSPDKEKFIVFRIKARAAAPWAGEAAP